MSDPDPFVTILGPLARLQDHVRAELAKRGLRLTHLGIFPSSDPQGAHQVQMLATLAEEPPSASIDDGFEEVLRGARAAELEARAKETIEDLRRRIDDDGFL